MVTIEPIDEDVRNDIRLWFATHEQTYAKVWDKLDQVRQRWQLADKRTRVTMLKASYLQAVFSVNTRWDAAEEAMLNVMAGQSVFDAMVNAGTGGQNNKKRLINRTLADDGKFEEACELIDEGKIDTAHELLTEFGYLGPAKAPFTLAQLGLTQKMCVDANVRNLLGVSKDAITDVAEEYEELCTEIQNLFPELSKQLRPYELQWLLFDFQRFNDDVPVTDTGRTVAQHTIWFDIILGDMNQLRRQMDRVTEGAYKARGELPGWMPTDDEIERYGDEIMEAIEERLLEDLGEEMQQAIKARI